jgi:hypothetical protein
VRRRERRFDRPVHLNATVIAMCSLSSGVVAKAPASLPVGCFCPLTRPGRILQSTDLLCHGAQESNLLGGGGHTMPGPGASPIPGPPTQPQSVEAASPPPCQPHTLAFSRTRAKGQRTDFELLTVTDVIQPKSYPGRCLAQKSWLVRALLAEW